MSVLNLSIENILCGVFGFLLGSAGVAHGSRKRNPVSFALGLMFLLAGAAAVFMGLVSKAVEEAEEEEAEEELEKAVEEAEAPEVKEEAAPEAEEAVPEAPKAEEEAPAAEEAPAEEEKEDA